MSDGPEGSERVELATHHPSIGGCAAGNWVGHGCTSFAALARWACLWLLALPGQQVSTLAQASVIRQGPQSPEHLLCLVTAGGTAL